MMVPGKRKYLQVLDYAAFSEKVASLIAVDLALPINPYDSLYTDLGLDSLQSFQLLIVIENLADAIPLDGVPELYTMQDAYQYYAHLVSTGA